MNSLIRCLIFLLLGLNFSSWAQIALPVHQGGVAKSNLILDYDLSKTATYSGSGSTIYDQQNTSGATLYNSPFFVAGANVLNFTAGSSQYLMTSADLSSRFSGITPSKHRNTTLLLWVYPTAANGVILSEQGLTTLNAGWHDSQIEMVNGQMKFRFWDLPVLSSSISTPLNNWYLVALTYDGRYTKAYINGQLAGSLDNANRQAPYNNGSGLYYCLACTDFTHLGSGGGYGSFRLGRFRVYNNALGAADISALYNSEKSNYIDAVLSLDAGQSASYSGTGTIWNDISGNGNNSSLYNITYQSTVGGGSMSFPNSANRYATFTAPISSVSTITVELWVRATSLNDGMFFGFQFYDVWTSGGGLGYNTAAGDLYGISSSQVSALGILNNWKHLVFVMKTGTYLGNKIYVNGASQTLSQLLNSQNASNTNFNAGSGIIGGWYANTSFRTLVMNLASFKIYDKELSAAEIQSKYNAEKSRYGL